MSKEFCIFANFVELREPMAKDSLIIEKIDGFIRKYYKNRLIKGLLYTAALLLSLFILVVLLEHFGYFGIGVRTFFFWAYIVAFVCLVGGYIVSPLMKMHKMGRRISYEEAALIIGKHFPEVKDKLLNLLQLQQAGEQVDNELLQAAIDQKSAQLRPVPFVNAVDLKGNRKYVKYVAVPAALIAAVLIVAPSFVTEPSKRILHHSVFYEKPAPFAFTVENNPLKVVSQNDFQLRVKVDGEALPSEVYVSIDGKNYRMQQQDKRHYTYLLKNVRESLSFHLTAADVDSKEYELQVLPNPTVLDFQVALTYPAYTGKKNEVLSNIGDLSVPEGTRVEWRFQTRSVESLHFLKEKMGGDSLSSYYTTLLSPNKNGRISYSERAMRSMNYGFFVANNQVPNSDTLLYSISTISDMTPMIVAVEMRDSLAPDRIFFKGRIKDDYGFSKLEFHLEVSNAKDASQKRVLAQKLAITKETSQEFFFSTNTAEMGLQPGDKVQYYFKVWDNDGVHGPKAATSQTFELKIPTQGELENMVEQNLDQIESKAESSIGEIKKLQQDINEMMQRLVDKKDLTWQDKQQLQQLAEKQKQVKDRLQKMQEQIKENNKLEQRYREQNEEVMEKQKELDKLMDKVLTDEMKQMMNEMDRLMQQMDKNKIQEQLEQMKVKNDDLKKQLDQNIELMKRLELEKKVDEAVRKAEDMSQRQKELGEESKNAQGKEKDQLLQKQKAMSEEFKDLQQDIKQIQQDYKKLDASENFDVDKKLQESIEQHQQNAENQLQKGKNSKAGEEQQQAGDDMQKLSEQMEQQQQQMEQQNTAEDSEQIRRLLKNLVQLSFNQEDLMGDVKRVYIQDPKYQQIIVDQNKVKTDFRGINDTLVNIAKRQIAVASAVNKELSAANSNIAKSLSDLLTFNQTFYGQSRNVQAATSMQYTMTSLNNLSLILAESLDKMQNQMRKNQKQKGSQCKKPNGKQKSKGQCSNPGGAKPSPQSMKEMQDALNKQMESLRQQLNKEGKMPGRTKIGEKNGMSEQFARMAAEQEQIRRMMQEYGEEMKQNNPGNGKLAREIDEMSKQMEQTETDLVNRTITGQTMKRQQQIMTRLLEHENADLKQQKEERRQSTEAKDIYQPSQGDLEKYEKLQEKNLELFRTTPPTLSPYYKTKVNEYFYKFKM